MNATNETLLPVLGSSGGKIKPWLMRLGKKISDWQEQRRIKRAVLKGPKFKFDIDEKRLKQKAGSPEEQGAIDGAQGLPPAAAMLLTKYEQDVLDLVEQEGQVLREKLYTTVARYEQAFKSVRINVEPASLEAIRRNCHEVERPRVIDDEKRILQPLKVQENQARCDLELFKTQNKLTRPEERSNPWLGSALIVIIVVLEAVINGYVLKDSQSAGVWGAVALSIAFSLCNISLAYFCGSVLGKNTLHIKIYRKLLAWLGILLMIPVFVAMNAWFAGVRTVAERDHQLSSGIDSASQQFIHAPIALIQEPGNLWMLVIGMAFTVLAFWKGMHFTDPYPGYSKMTGRADKAAKTLQYGIDKARHRLGKHYRESEQAMQALAAHNRQTLLEFHTNQRDYLNLADTYNYAVAKLNNLLQSLVFNYRTANLQHRGDTPPPRYFGTPMKMTLKTAAFNSDQLVNMYQELSNRSEYFEQKSLSQELRYLSDLSLFALAQLDAEILKILGEPLDELPSLPPLRPESTASLNIQPKNKPDNGSAPVV